MAGQASDYHRGDMDIHAQQSTFHRVMAMTKWASLVVATGVMFFTLWFCTAAGFPTAFLCAVILIAIGVFALRERPGPSH